MLAARFYDPASGVIRIGGAAYPEVGTQELMRRVSICFQESQLFKGTIEDNIRMGNTDAPLEAVMEAARAARADEFISRLPLTYQTRIAGDRMLSGGQIQRIAIARAILKDSPIVVLDEATSYADPENERLIQEALNELLRDRTVMVVAHRIKTLRHVDQILVFDEGRIVEAGGWDELAAAGGTFTRLLRSAEAALSWSVKPTTEQSEVANVAR
jgi:ATP-binding cassette subfamily B protein